VFRFVIGLIYLPETALVPVGWEERGPKDAAMVKREVTITPNTTDHLLPVL
jgi:hypothetical protein